MEINERLAKLEADENNIFHQLSEIKGELRDMRSLINAVESIAVRTESIDEKMDTMGGRISVLEREPIGEFKHYKRLVMGAIITSVINTLAVGIITLILRA